MFSRWNGIYETVSYERQTSLKEVNDQTPCLLGYLTGGYFSWAYMCSLSVFAQSDIGRGFELLNVRSLKRVVDASSNPAALVHFLPLSVYAVAMCVCVCVFVTLAAFDGGDCCSCTCVSGKFACGEDIDFTCLDPSAACFDDGTGSNSSSCTPLYYSDGDCDLDNNSEECGACHSSFCMGRMLRYGFSILSLRNGH